MAFFRSDHGSSHTPPGPPLIAIVTFWAFVLGGIAFGAIFVENWRVLGARPDRKDGTPAPPVMVSAGPVSVKMPVPISAPPVAAQAPKQNPNPQSNPPPLASGLANVVKTVIPDWTGTDRINMLLLGIDKRDDEPYDGTRSDTMILASIDPVTRSVTLVSLPRDMWVTIPGCAPAYGCVAGRQRINVAHAIGGPELSARTVSTDFGIPIQYYARVDFRGFEQLVDAVGGVIIDVDQPVKDDEYPTDDYGYQRIYFGPGPQLMDGRAALQYARSRHGTNDFLRAGRQQKVLVSLRQRALQLNMLSKAPELIGIVQKALATNLSPTEMLPLAKLLSQIDRDHISQLVIDTNYVQPFVGYEGADLLEPNYPAINAAITRKEQEAAHPELKARVEVLNGSGTAGLGQKAADYLSKQGFNVVHIAAAERSDYRSSIVQVLTSDRHAAEAVAALLQVPQTAISDEPTSNPQADIRIVVGQDFRLPTS